jgi:tRNA U34 2-thiouridine synthase MnmA/TrmU
MNSQNKIKAIGLLSGGLDSSIAVKIILNQKIEVTALNFVTPFCTCTRKGCKHEACRISNLFNIPLKIISSNQDYIKMIRNPDHGYGRNMNPCIDCRIFMFKKAKEFMEEIGASFIFTGEVLGQRPMSQHKKAMNLIEKNANLERMIVRPLSAKLLELTIPEEKGWIDRDKLLSIQGRRRIPQMELANKFGISDYPCPAGGCRLTDPNFSKRLKDSFDYGEDSNKDILLLKYGRHFRLDNGKKIIVGRNDEENKTLIKLCDKQDALLEVEDVGSPIVLVRGSINKNDVMEAANFCFKYSDAVDKTDAKLKMKYGDNLEKIIRFES